VREALRGGGGRDLARLHALAWDRLVGSRMAVEACRGLAAGRAVHRSRAASPPRLDDAALLAVLVQRGVGRPSTLATIGESLEARGYLAHTDGSMRVTPLGGRVLSWLDRTLPGTLDAAFTERLESRLDAVEAGELPWRAAVAEAWTPLAPALGRVVA
jgi:DNA topoisomerase IA